MDKSGKLTNDDIQIKLMYTLKCTKEQFTLITKALTGNLRPEEVTIAREYGLDMLTFNTENLNSKLEAAEHALKLANVKK